MIVDPQVRLLVWSVAVLSIMVVTLIVFFRHPIDSPGGDIANATITESGAERFGLYMIIVLGESILGVVNGMVTADRAWIVIATGMFALALGAGMWWCYFDFIGMRIARGAMARAGWYLLHLPLSAAIAAVGAGMTGLVANAAAPRTPPEIAWLIGGSLAVALVCVAALARLLPQLPGERFIPFGLLCAAGFSLAMAALTPPPWLFPLLLLMGMQTVWGLAFWSSAQHRRLVDGTPMPSAAGRGPGEAD